MDQTSMTAYMSAFVRAWHTEEDGGAVFRDPLAHQLLGRETYDGIASSLTAGAGFFGVSEEDAPGAIVRRWLAPTPLGRAAFAERALETAVRTGAGQYLLLGAGCDTFAYRRPRWAEKLEVFELDRPAAIADKQARLRAAGIEIPPHTHHIAADLAAVDWTDALTAQPAFRAGRISFCSLLGLVYYLPEAAWRRLLAVLAALLPAGSALAFDYPLPVGGSGAKLNRLAAGAGERMQAAYTPQAMETLLAESGWLVYEHPAPRAIEERFFAAHNAAYPARRMAAPPDVRYCLAVRGR